MIVGNDPSLPLINSKYFIHAPGRTALFTYLGLALPHTHTGEHPLQGSRGALIIFSGTEIPQSPPPVNPSTIPAVSKEGPGNLLPLLISKGFSCPDSART